MPQTNIDEAPRDVILRAADLSRNPRYRQQRADFYAWQERTVEEIVRNQLTVATAVSEMQTYVNQLNAASVKYWRDLTKKAAFTVVGIGLPLQLVWQSFPGWG